MEREQGVRTGGKEGEGHRKYERGGEEEEEGEKEGGQTRRRCILGVYTAAKGPARPSGPVTKTTQ